MRNGITDFLGFMLRVGRSYDPVVPLLSDALAEMRDPGVLDCCSGAGGPWSELYDKLDLAHPGIRVQLCDYFPNDEARRSFNARFLGRAEYLARPVDARDIPPDLPGFRTFFSSFHHFGPGDARRILQDAAAKQTGIGIFEVSQRSGLAVLWMLLVPVVVWIVTPFLRPFSWKRLAFTYLIPVIPLVIAWDGLASCLRTYSCDELRSLSESVRGNYQWHIGELKGPVSPVPVTFLIGLPKSAEIRGIHDRDRDRRVSTETG